MHDCAMLVDIESYIYMLRNAETKRPKKQCYGTNRVTFSLVYLATISG